MFSRRNTILAALGIALASLAFTVSKPAFSEDSSAMDTSAFSAWSGKYYVESEEVEPLAFPSFEVKKEYFLKDGSVMEKREDFEIDADGNRVEEPAPAEPVAEPELPPETKPKAPPKAKSQAYYFYNHGSLKNASLLEKEGRGYVKVFRDRDRSIGGRGFGTRSLITAIKDVAEAFAQKFPGRERIQIADMAKKSGGSLGHLSHQNGLEADVIYVRKSHKEQLAYGGYGKNGFAEQFVVPGKVTSKSYKDSKGRKRVMKVTEMKVSSNFDMVANFEMLMLFQTKANVFQLFVDKVLIREIFKYAEDQKRSEEPEVKAMLMKLDHQPSHADHVHVRLMCQETDKNCVSNIQLRKR